jgi:hypothetical protein
MMEMVDNNVHNAKQFSSITNDQRYARRTNQSGVGGNKLYQRPEEIVIEPSEQSVNQDDLDEAQPSQSYQRNSRRNPQEVTPEPSNPTISPRIGVSKSSPSNKQRQMYGETR